MPTEGLYTGSIVRGSRADKACCSLPVVGWYAWQGNGRCPLLFGREQIWPGESRVNFVAFAYQEDPAMSEISEARFRKTISEMDAANEQDPHQELVNGKPIPKELIYGIRMSEMLIETYPDAQECLRLAARAQHIQRWTIPRTDYPMDRKGYLRWRTRLKQFHGELAGNIMKDNGYTELEIRKVEDLLNKRRLKTDPEVQALEDVVCLVFLKYYFQDFIQKHRDETHKLIGILQKTWNKMSEKGQKKALAMSHPEPVKRLLAAALGET